MLVFNRQRINDLNFYLSSVFYLLILSVDQLLFHTDEGCELGKNLMLY